MLFAFSMVPAVYATLPSPEITIYPNSLSPNSSFIMTVDPMTSKTPMRLAWSVYNPNVNGNYIMGQLPVKYGKGICYFSNVDGNATCGPSPFYGTGEMSVMVYSIAADVYGMLETGNSTKVTTLGSIMINGQPVLSEENRNVVLLAYYMPPSEAESMKFSVYSENMQTISGLQDKALEFKTSPTAGYYGNITLEPGTYYISTVARKASDYGGKMDRITVPEVHYDSLIVYSCESQYWFGETVNISGETTYDDVSVTVTYPNGSVILTEDVSVYGESFAFFFTPDLVLPAGFYNITIEAGNFKKYKTVSYGRILTVNPLMIEKDSEKEETFTDYVNVKNNDDTSHNITFSVTGNMKTSYLSMEDTLLEPDEEAILNISIDSVPESIDGSIILSAGKSKTEVPVILDVPYSGGGDGDCPKCPECPEEKDCPECPAVSGGGLIEVSPSVWSQNVVKDQEASVSITITNNHNETIDGFSYEFIPDYSSDNDELSYATSSPYFDELEIDADDYDSVDFSFIPEYTGSYKGKLEISSDAGSAFIFVDIDVMQNVSEDIQYLRESVEALSDEIETELYAELISYVDDAASDVYLGNYESASMEIEKARAIKDIISNYGNSLSGAGEGDECEPCNCAETGSMGGGFDIMIIILIVIIIALGAVGAFIYMKSKSGEGEMSSEEGDFGGEFDDEELGDY